MLELNYENLLAKKVGQYGLQAGDLKDLAERLPQINRKIEERSGSADFSFRRLPFQKQTISLAKDLAKKLQRQFDNFVVVGIGGSSLGAKAICKGLGTKNSKQIFFCGDTTNPVMLDKLLAKIDLSKTVFNVVSKSGDTLETLAVFLILREKVIKKVGLQNSKKHFIITIGENNGVLRQIALKEGYEVLTHYEGSGRFSALSINGLLPAVWLGIDIDKLLDGARQMDKIARSDNFAKNLPYIYAGAHYLGYKSNAFDMAVLWPYAENINDFTLWFRQLWAESLGKKGIGLTPIAALGVQDQHSQLQLYNEGKNDKIFTFLQIKKWPVDFVLPKINSLEFLAAKKLSAVLNIEAMAVEESLAKNKRPNCRLVLPVLDEFHFGQLIYFYEMATVYLGEFFNINAFNQPGVEESKKIMLRELKK